MNGLVLKKLQIHLESIQKIICMKVHISRKTELKHQLIGYIAKPMKINIIMNKVDGIGIK